MQSPLGVSPFSSRRHPTRREVPLGTRRLGFARQNPLAATRFELKNGLKPRAFFRTAVLKRRAGRRLPPRRVRCRSALEDWCLLRRAAQATDRKNYSAACSVQRFRSARLGDSFYFAISKIVESLLRRGARNLERTALRPGRPRLRRGGGASRHPVLAIRARKQSLSARGRKLGLLGNKLRRPCAGGGRKGRN